MGVWDKYSEVFLKYNVKKFEGELCWFDPAQMPYINSNIISSVYLEFKTPNETSVSWMEEELCLALTIINAEVVDITLCYVGCKIELIVGDKSFSKFDGDLVEYITSNRLTRLTMRSDVNIRDHQAAVVRYVRDKGVVTDFNKLYLECVRDTRQQ